MQKGRARDLGTASISRTSPSASRPIRVMTRYGTLRPRWPPIVPAKQITTTCIYGCDIISSRAKV